MDLPLILYDSVEPFTDEQVDELCNELGCNFEYELPYHGSDHYLFIVIPLKICDTDVVWSLQENGHKNIIRRTDI